MSVQISPASRILVALDRPDPAEARALMRTLAPLGCGFKVGLTLLPMLGEAEIAEMTAEGGKLFLDYKLHDIGQTVAGAVRTICRTKAAFLTVHAEAPVMRAAVAAKSDENLKLLGVTVLTSLDDSDLQAAGYKDNVAELTARRAKQAKEIGMDGLICSPMEVAALRKIVGAEMCLITPGVRPLGSDQGDQKRVMTPRDALLAGADYLVIGRPIVAAPDPAQALADIIATLPST